MTSAESAWKPSRKIVDGLNPRVYFSDQLINQWVKRMVADALSTTFAALADPTRRAILSRLSSGEASVKELAQPFSMSLPAISKHLKVLERAGLIERGREAQWRPCRLQVRPLKQASDWIDQYREFWEERLDRLEEYLRHVAADEPAGGEAGPSSPA